MGETCSESSRVAVETAVDLARGFRRDKWEDYRSRMKGKIALWEENVPPPEGSHSVELLYGDPTTDYPVPSLEDQAHESKEG